MAQSSELDNALSRLNTALNALDAAVGRRLEADQERGALEVELQRMDEDRARLAQSLDSTEARSQRLEDANREVSKRLVAAMESIRTVLDRRNGV